MSNPATKKPSDLRSKGNTCPVWWSRWPTYEGSRFILADWDDELASELTGPGRLKLDRPREYGA